MAVLLLRSYKGYAANTVVELTTSEENALIAQNLAQTALITAVTTGNVTSNSPFGTVAIAAGASSVVITNTYVDTATKVFAVVAQAAADTTLLRVERVVCASGAAGQSGTITIYGTANATATTLIDWAIVGAVGLTPTL